METTAEEAMRVRARADCLHDVEAVQAAYDRLAGDIQFEYADSNPVILCVMIGGLVATAEIVRRLKFPFQLDYLHATRYRGSTQGGSITWKASPETVLADRHVLVIDDILDEGHTLVEILRTLRARGPASVKSCVLAEKRHVVRAVSAAADFVGLEVENRYVFGCGMDYKGYYRQLPAIYAVRED